MPDAALSDIRVLDLAGEIGVYAAKLLADLGADVIRIEPPDGDPARLVGPFYHDEPSPERSLYFFNLNTNKRGITLDVMSDEGRELFKRLVATADVVVETFHPGVLDAAGVGYEALAKVKPEIIVTSVTGFGQDGPHAGYRWSDIVGVAMGGMMTLAGDKADPPNMPYGYQGYIGAGIQAAAGTMMALTHRDNTGEGQHVDVSMQEALSINQETAMQTYDMTKQIRTRTGARGALPIDIPGIGVYPTSDGNVFAYLGTPGGAPWPVMLQWMTEEGKAADLNESPYVEMIGQLNLRFLTGLAALAADPPKLQEALRTLAHIYEVFAAFCKTMTKWTLYEEGQKRRLMFGIVSTPEDLVRNPQLQARKWLQDVGHDELDETLRYAGPPYRLSETPWAIRRRAPLPGEHNSEVYCGELGLGEQDLATLRERGVI
jgi:crotonobetainyl-CoA:carnitine CoA-transferase CaiB-like acyl-CoA transferase